MSPLIWLALWAVVIFTVAFFYVREVRRKRTPVEDFDRTQHQAVGESLTMQQRTRGYSSDLGV